MDKKSNFACVFRKKVLPLCPNFESTSETMSGQSQETQLIVSVEDTLMNTGTHSDLFGKTRR